MATKISLAVALAFSLGVTTGILALTVFSSGRAEVHRIASTEPTGVVEPLSGATSTYRNTSYNFSLSYPSELSVDEYDEGDGARTIVFRKGAEDFGFQIFITPYASDTVSYEFLARENPSLLIEDATTTTVATRTALLFSSKAPGIGPSREIWFADRGHVFQVTTYPNLADWLANILKTWQFD